MTAITTKFHGPTNTRGSRITATAEGTRQRVTIPYPHEAQDNDAAHRMAAEALVAKMGWTGALAEGDTRRGRVFVFVPEVVVDAFRFWSFNDDPNGREVYDDLRRAEYTVGGTVTHCVAVPGRGHVTYRVTRITDDGVFGVVVASTARELTPVEVR